jgi:hypothetical protein
LAPFSFLAKKESVAMLAPVLPKQVDSASAQRLHDMAVALGAECRCTQGADRLQRFNPNHYGPGERGGQFAPSGEGGGGASANTEHAKPVQVASNDTGVRTDAGAGQPEQVAGGGEPDEEGGRGRGPIEDEFVDATAPIRQEFYNAARAKLRTIDPSNQALPSVQSRDWVPSKEDVNAMRGALDRAIEDNAAKAAAHGYERHVVRQHEFPEIRSQADLQALAKNVMKTNPPERGINGQIFFYQSTTNTLVVINPRNPAQSSIFRPTAGRPYVDRNVEEE